jgi:hypothetical protein
MRTTKFSLNKNAQVLSIDLITSIVIFILVVSLFLVFWINMHNKVIAQEKFISSQELAMKILDSFIKTPGYPFDWNESNVVQIGLVSEPNVIPIEKFRKFLNLPYSDIKRITKIGENEIKVRLKYRNGTTILDEFGIPLEKGLDPLANVTLIVPLERYCLLNLENTTVLCVLEFKLWSP